VQLGFVVRNLDDLIKLAEADVIIFVGDEASDKNVDPNVAFVGTKSYKTLLDWIYRMDIDISVVCMYNRTSPELSWWTDQKRKRQRCIRFVALGEKAAIQLEKNNVGDFYKLPHPSGLNRKLNDKEWVEEELSNCKEWINEQELQHNKNRY
jgi:hypothetical protein